MSIKPDERYASVDELASEIRAFTQGFATEAEHAGFLTQLSLLIKRNRMICIISSACLSIIILITSLFMLSLKEEKEAALQSEQAAQAAEKIALEADQRSISIRQNVAPELLDYARNQYLLHRYRKAESLTKKALESDPKLEAAKVELIFQLFALHEFEQSLKLANELNTQIAEFL